MQSYASGGDFEKLTHLGSWDIEKTVDASSLRTKVSNLLATRGWYTVDLSGLTDEIQYAYSDSTTHTFSVKVKVNNGKSEATKAVAEADLPVPTTTPTPVPTDAPTPVPTDVPTPVPTDVAEQPTAEPEVTPEAAAAWTTLKEGDSGALVTEVQERLHQLGYLSQDATGTFDSSTTDAVKRFQEQCGLTVTGEVDQDTYDRLMSGDAPVAPATVEPTEESTEESAEESTEESTEEPGFMQKELTKLGDFSVKTWMAIVLAIVVIGLIVLIVILRKPSKKTPPEDDSPKPGTNDYGYSYQVSPTEGTVGTDTVPTDANERTGGGDETTVYTGTGDETTVYHEPAGPTVYQTAGVNDETMGKSAMVRFTIVTSAGASRSETASVAADPFIIGRSAQSNLVLTGDQSVSKVHAELTYDGAVMRLTDRSSHHSTLVNNLPLSDGQAVLNPGTTLTLGETFVTLDW